ncbi:fimbrial protein [Serratia sarumanii]|uniref:fimbrial protein n=1 Tax=Serratia sarumanii TaxID=3020826 RepID=UPI003F805ACA
MKKLIFAFFILPIYCDFCFASDCRIDWNRHGGKYFDKTVNLPGNSITVGSDLPNGTVLFTGNISNINNKDATNYSNVYCKNTSRYTYTVKTYSELVSNSPESLPGVYPTNIEGVGVRISNLGGENPGAVLSNGKKILYDSVTKEIVPFFYKEFFEMSNGYKFELIKTGNIRNVGVVNGSSFPIIRIVATSDNGVANGPQIPVDYYESRRGDFSFEGFFPVVVASCNVDKNILVNLGDHDASEIPSIGKATPWVDASITLTNCPNFTGNNNQLPYEWLGANGGDVNIISPFSNNYIQFAIAPRSPVISVPDGIVSLTDSPGSAKGVGVQIMYGTKSSYRPLIFFATNRLNIKENSGSILKIPLVARYIRTSDNLLPGKADTIVEFYINYN